MTRVRFYIAVLCVVLLSAGCVKRQAVSEKKPPPVTVQVEEKRELPPLPETPLVAVEGEKGSPESFTKPARRLDVSLKDADVREVLLSLAREGGFEIVIDPAVSGKVTLEMREAIPLDVVREVCRAAELTCTVHGELIRVQRRRMVTRYFYVDYIVTSRQGTGTLSATTTTTTSEDTSSTTSAGGTTGGEDNESTNTITTEETMNVWATLKEELSSFLSGEGARLSIVPETGMITVTDYPENLEMVGEYLSSLEKRLKSQVLIDAKIVEVTLSDTNRYGIDWSAIADLSALRLRGNLAGGATFSQNLSAGETAFQFGVASNKVDFVLDALAQQGQVNILSSPRVSTLNNQKAIIRIGTQDVFFRAVVTPATETTAPVTSFTPETITEGIILSVTPQVGRDGTITLAIHPSISEKTGEAVAPDGNTAPIIDVREANTVISVRDGETVLIGGLIQDRSTETVTSVPFLGDIPFLGALFRKTVQEKAKTELVILLTPRVVTEANLREIVTSEAERVRYQGRGFHLGARPWLYGTEGETKLLW